MHLFGLSGVCVNGAEALAPLILSSFPAPVVGGVEEACCTSRGAASFLDADVDETGAGKDADVGRFLMEDRLFFRRAIEDEPCVWICAGDGDDCPGTVPILPPPSLLMAAAAADDKVAAAASVVRYRRRIMC
mmetsp:Transcript_16148/g.46365  ORF Transcript_16148/g.46365 Transcript_16148/m.46365 type:complete len:132 (-) Transcript_16148:79-474(-)